MSVDSPRDPVEGSGSSSFVTERPRPNFMGLMGAIAGAWISLVDMAPDRGVLWVWGMTEVWSVAVAVVVGLVAGVLLGWLLQGPRTFRNLLPTLSLQIGALVVLLLSCGVAWTWVRMDERLEFPDAPQRPQLAREGHDDVFIFLLDAVRRDGVYDETGIIHDKFETMSALAQEAVVFSNARSTAPWTVPSHASLFTGLSTLDHKCSQETPFLSKEFETLAERLTGMGYRTAGVVVNPWLSTGRGYAQGFEIYEQIWEGRHRMPLLVRWAETFKIWKPADQYRRDKGTAAAMKRLSKVLATVPEDQPLFVFVNLISAHPLLHAPEPSHDLCLSPEIRNGPKPTWRVPQDWMNILTGVAPLDDWDMRALKELYAGEIHYMDRHLGEMFETMRAQDRYDDAAVVITSDHGCGLGEDGKFASGFDLHERMLQIPLIVKQPGGRGGGTVVDTPAQLHDLFPSTLAWAGASSPAARAARDAIPLFGDAPREISFSAFAQPLNMLYSLWLQHPRYDRTPWERRLFGVIEGNHKLIWSSTEGMQLFDVMRDPYEIDDLSAQEPERLDAMAAMLREAIGGDVNAVATSMAGWVDFGSGTLGLDENTRESLRSLGYIGGGGD